MREKLQRQLAETIRSFPAPLSVELPNEPFLPMTPPKPKPKTLEQAVSWLPRTERRVIGLGYFKGKSDRDIAFILGLRTARVSWYRKSALRELKYRFRDAETIGS